MLLNIKFILLINYFPAWVGEKHYKVKKKLTVGVKKSIETVFNFPKGDEYVNECYSSPFDYGRGNKVLFTLTFISA